MKLTEALRIINAQRSDQPPLWQCGLACGFTPLHLQTYLHACLINRTTDAFAFDIGLYGDLVGNIQRFTQAKCEKVIAVVEWADLDARLGYRTTHGWRTKHHADIVSTAATRLQQLTSCIAVAAEHSTFVVALPTIPLPPITHQTPTQGADIEFRLQAEVMQFGLGLAAIPNVRVLSPQQLDLISPLVERYDARADLNSGFPYHKKHAHALAEQLASLLLMRAPSKGIITDLDNTLWRGILGEDGLNGVHWDLDHGSLSHGLYQEVLQSLAVAGVLLAVASKNDAALVEQAFQRDDLVIDTQKHFFPIEAHWDPKSKSVARILKQWNIGADSVTFIDDSQMEIAEVQNAFPDMDCQLFSTKDDRAVLDLIWSLRHKFGKQTVSQEDRIRAESLRAAATRTEVSDGVDQDQFLAQSEAEIVFHFGDDDPRTLELINKTNQFNINGRRYDEAEWRERLRHDDYFLLSVSYQDKFGPLGKIAVVVGSMGEAPKIETFVMSCRAFSRRIEFQALEAIFNHVTCDQIEIAYQPTERNGPACTFLSSITDEEVQGPVQVSRDTFDKHKPSLFGSCTVHE